MDRLGGRRAGARPRRMQSMKRDKVAGQLAAAKQQELSQMPKWEVHVIFIVAAPYRDEAWRRANALIRKHLGDTAHVERVSQKPLEEA